MWLLVSIKTVLLEQYLSEFSLYIAPNDIINNVVHGDLFYDY